MTAPTTYTGRVKMFNADRGFGFLRSDHADVDQFFHITEWTEMDLPARGMRVQYTLGTDARGREQAKNVAPVGSEPNGSIGTGRRPRTVLSAPITQG